MTKSSPSRVQRRIIKPQPGPQEVFLSTEADIAIYGGAAGGGKSFALLTEALRHTPRNPHFSAVYFRRNTTQVRNPGGLWDESMKLFPWAGGVPIRHSLEWSWPNGGKVKMAHLEHETTVLDWQGAQIPLICLDELTHFSQTQFFYLLSRNRSTCGVRPYVRATTNPDADSWVASFIAWWIDQATGYPIPERAGKLRWFIRLNDVIIWADSPQELRDKYGRPDLPDDHEDQVMPKSVTFIPAKLSDNRILMKADPGYLANLKAMSTVERERLLGGNWKIKPAAGLYFKRQDVSLVDIMPSDVVAWVRRWDLAATEPSETNPDPDWTAGVLMGRRANGRYIIADVVHMRKRSDEVRKAVKRTAENDTQRFGSGKVKIWIPQDPGQAGVQQVEDYTKFLSGYSVRSVRETGDKVTRADPFAAQWQANNVDVLRAPWNDTFFGELEAFPSTAHDDQVDAASGAFHSLTKSKSMLEAL